MTSRAENLELEIERFNAEELEKYSRFPEIRNVINDGFGDAVSKNPNVLQPRAKRFESDQQMLDQLGDDAVLFLMTLRTLDDEHDPGKRRIVATASYKPYKTTWSIRSEFDAETQKALAIGERRNLTEADIPTVHKVLESFARDNLHEDVPSVEIVAVATAPEWRK